MQRNIYKVLLYVAVFVTLTISPQSYGCASKMVLEKYELLFFDGYSFDDVEFAKFYNSLDSLQKEVVDSVSLPPFVSADIGLDRPGLEVFRCKFYDGILFYAMNVEIVKSLKSRFPDMLSSIYDKEFLEHMQIMAEDIDALFSAVTESYKNSTDYDQFLKVYRESIFYKKTKFDYSESAYMNVEGILPLMELVRNRFPRVLADGDISPFFYGYCMESVMLRFIDLYVDENFDRLNTALNLRFGYIEVIKLENVEFANVPQFVDLFSNSIEDRLKSEITNEKAALIFEELLKNGFSSGIEVFQVGAMSYFEENEIDFFHDVDIDGLFYYDSGSKKLLIFARNDGGSLNSLRQESYWGTQLFDHARSYFLQGEARRILAEFEVDGALADSYLSYLNRIGDPVKYLNYRRTK